MSAHLFRPLQLGPTPVPSRIVMAPMTRCRAAQPGDVPTALMAQYYAQRASAGLIISEATQISPLGKGYLDTPGIYQDSHVEAWAKIVRAVHAGGFVQVPRYRGEPRQEYQCVVPERPPGLDDHHGGHRGVLVFEPARAGDAEDAEE